jgi:hypothetical protein
MRDRGSTRIDHEITLRRRGGSPRARGRHASPVRWPCSLTACRSTASGVGAQLSHQAYSLRGMIPARSRTRTDGSRMARGRPGSTPSSCAALEASRLSAGTRELKAAVSQASVSQGSIMATELGDLAIRQTTIGAWAVYDGKTTAGNLTFPCVARAHARPGGGRRRRDLRSGKARTYPIGRCEGATRLCDGAGPQGLLGPLPPSTVAGGVRRRRLTNNPCPVARGPRPFRAVLARTPDGEEDQRRSTSPHYTKS